MSGDELVGLYTFVQGSMVFYNKGYNKDPNTVSIKAQQTDQRQQFIVDLIFENSDNALAFFRCLKALSKFKRTLDDRSCRHCLIITSENGSIDYRVGLVYPNGSTVGDFFQIYPTSITPTIQTRLASAGRILAQMFSLKLVGARRQISP